MLVIDQEDVHIKDLASQFSIPVNTIEEFNTATINNIEYFEFLSEMKKQRKLTE